MQVMGYITEEVYIAWEREERAEFNKGGAVRTSKALTAFYCDGLMGIHFIIL